MQRYLIRPALRALIAVSKLVDRIKAPYMHAGVWVISICYGILILVQLAWLFAFLVVMVVSGVVYALIPVALFIGAVWILAGAGGDIGGGIGGGPSKASVSGRPNFGAGESREREGLLGDSYTEHRDKDGDYAGESREREGILGDKYTENKKPD